MAKIFLDGKGKPEYGYGMKLKDYLAKVNMRPTAFAREIGVAPTTVTRWIRGHRHPEMRAVQKIIKATRGRVTANDFLPLADSAE